MPPIVGTDLLWIFLSSEGLSISRFNIATFMSAGVAYNTTTNEVKNTSINSNIKSRCKS